MVALARAHGGMNGSRVYLYMAQIDIPYTRACMLPTHAVKVKIHTAPSTPSKSAPHDRYIFSIAHKHSCFFLI